MNCPICHTENITDSAVVCPHCKTSFASFALIQSLDAQQDTTHQSISILQGKSLKLESENKVLKKQNIRAFIFAFFAILLWFATLLNYLFSSPKIKKHDHNLIVESYRKDIHLLNDTLYAIRDQNKQMQVVLENFRNNQSGIIQHVVTKTENLYTISLAYYNDASMNLVAKIAKFNKVARPELIYTGDTILLKPHKKDYE